jgi:dihydroorotate dehydrogenase (NAD+) catalytic subunit
MWLKEDAHIQKRDINLKNPFVNAAATLGFAPHPPSMPFLKYLGAFITNPISRFARQPAGNRTCLSFPGGLLLHSGHPNPGISHIIRRFSRRWASAPLPIIVHLLVETPHTLTEMVHKLEGLENILALELGLPPDIDPQALPTLMEAAQGELPLILALSFDQVPSLLEVISQLQPSAIHLTEPRGMLSGQDGKWVRGRLDGPAIFPLMVKAAKQLVEVKLRVIVNAGVYLRWQADALLASGVFAVALGSALWQVNTDNLFLTL